ncbi:MAG: radical SAM protein [Desulfobacula sp.]|nr:radical SAM protein [Desulfobacula sp.]
MKILFVNPACLDPRIMGEDARVVPIGVYYMAALLMENKFDVRILNLAALDPDKDAVQTFGELIEKEKPDLIGFSVTNPNRINAIACAKAARKRLPQTCIVFGGPAPTFMAPYLLKACPEIDILVQGEGESTLLSLVKALAKTGSVKGASVRNIKGIAFLEDKKIIETGPAQVVQDLDSLVHPSTYFVFEHLSMSRGCPGTCTFCGSPKFWGKSGIRFHSPLWFVTEILSLAKKGVTHFYISDDTFTMDRERVIAVCKLIISADIPITWNAISRVDYIDRELLFWMRRAGCIQISFGVESGSKEIKKNLGKPISNERCIQAFSLTRSYGILPRAYFIYGSPGETQETIRESCDLMMALKPLATVFYLLVIFPGTHLYGRALAKGQVTDAVWDQKIEDLPWFELDDTLDFSRVKFFGDTLRETFFNNLAHFVHDIALVEEKELYPFHSDFLSRLAMTFSHGEYAKDPRIKDPAKIAERLFTRALSYSPCPRAFLGMAMLFQQQKKINRAAALLTKGLSLFPGNKELSVCMGVTLMNQAKFKDALPFFTLFKDDPGMDPYITICNTREQTP